jgi:beta-galactosidase
MQHPLPGHILYGGDYNPEQWSEEVWHEDMQLMKRAHINMVTINVFSWALLEPEPGQYTFETLDRIMDLLQSNGIAADLATATASPPTWMSRLYPSMLPVTAEGIRLNHGSRQQYCPNSPDYRREATELVRQLAQRYAQHAALAMWHINNEYGCHVPACYCDDCAIAFRAWLQQRYHTLDALNKAWSTNFWSQHYYHWEDIIPPRASPAQVNPAQRLDYWRFMSDSLLDCYRMEEEILRATTPHIPLTTNFMVAFKPVDLFAWAPHVDIASFDMYPPNTAPASWNALHHDLMRSLKHGQPHIVMEQSPSQVNWMQQNPQKRPGQMRLHALQGIAHGADGALFFQWRQSQGGAEKYHAAMVTHEGSEHNRIFRQTIQLGAELERISQVVVGSRIHAQVAMIMDWDSWWDVEYLPGPNDRLHYAELLGKYYHAFHQLNVGVDVVQASSDLSGYRIVIAPLLHLLHRGDAQNLTRFVENGGVLLTTFFSGIVDEYDHVGLGGYPAELRDLLGIRVEEFDPWTQEMWNNVVISEGGLAGTYRCELWGELVHLAGAQALGTFECDYYAQHPALTVNHYGNGYAYYLATQPDDDLLTMLAHEFCQQAGVNPALADAGPLEVTKRVQDDGTEIYFVLNHTGQTQHVPLPSGAFISLLSDEAVPEGLEIAPLDAMILKKV